MRYIVSMTPKSTSQSEPMPTVLCNPSHSSSHLILSTDSLDNPDNPRPNTHWSPSIADWGTWASIPAILFGASTNTVGIQTSTPVYWTHDWAKAQQQFPLDPNPVSLYSN